MVAPPHRREAQDAWSIDRRVLLVAQVLCAAVFSIVTRQSVVAQGNPATSSAEDVEASEDDEANAYRDGLVATYTGADAKTYSRLEEQIAFDWGADPPEARVPRGPFEAQFAGHLQVRAPGKYRLRVFAAGAVRLVLDGKTLVDASSREPAWLDAEAVELAFDYLPLEVRYRRTDEPARLALFWEGPGFELEPIPARWLCHEKVKTPSDAFERGARLVRALRCAACHDLPGEATTLAAPSLDKLAGNLSRSWLVERLAGASPSSSRGADDRARGRMPHFDFSPSEAAAIADHLWNTSEATPPPNAKGPPASPDLPKKKRKNVDEPPRLAPSAMAGATLFRSVGCLACHRIDKLGTDGLFGGGDLSRVAAKRPGDFFGRWLADPAATNRDHRMPVFALDADERESLALYLQELHTAPASTASLAADSSAPSKPGRGGRELIERANCAACHALAPGAGIARRQAGAKLDPTTLSRETGTCLDVPDKARHRPGYRLPNADRQAITAYIEGMAGVKNPATIRSGREVLAERNCLACHARGWSRGLASHVPAIVEADPALRDVAPAMTPPAIFGIGDKLRDEALAAAIAVSLPPRQTWLRARMPKFPLADDEARAIARQFIDEDRIPELAGRARLVDSPGGDASAAQAAGARLVTADGFGCTSCHAIGKWTPQKVALNAQGSDLSMIGKRIRAEWFGRWVRNPARIVPQMEMPAVQQSVRGVLAGNLDGQLAAIWQVLNLPGFNPPSPSALRVLRRANLPAVTERAAVLTELIEVDGRPFVKPLVIGLPNRHNVLFDLATNRLAAWWIGDTARQQTRGKSWHWEAGVPQLLEVIKPESPKAISELALLRDKARELPVADGQYLSEFDSFEHMSGGLRFSQRLRFQLDNQPVTVHVRHEFSPLVNEASQSGFRRRCEIEGAQSDAAYEWTVLRGAVSLDQSGRIATLEGASRLQVELRTPAEGRLIKTSEGAAVVLPGTGGKAVACELDYRAALVADQFAPLPQVDRGLTRETLAVVPGYEGVRLPVTDQAMPTGLAWRADGTLVVSSLEGRVWLGCDSDDDGLEDRLEPFSDELAAPYGVCASGGSIDVINKYGLLRLSDDDGDGRADRARLFASGWGHTRDYHDWAVGLPRDDKGNYFVSLPCQQDERSEAAATLRGTIIKLVGRQPTADDPRVFSIEPVCAGLRFPQGMALARGGDLFVTDNQGNYTPFNELNHVVAGARYGFINRLESGRGLNPPFRSAAIEIPHPWTRSVNGICFLDAPSAAREAEGQKLFGPFAGHVIGCEYDTRRLVRMSLERVAGEWQGAVYPFSREPAAGETTFEGPLVCQVAPNGDLYVGNIRDSGWGAGSNTGSLVRLRPSGELPPGIAEVRLARDGLVIDFTRPVDRAKAAEAANYALSSYRRIPTPDYGGPDRDRRVESIAAVDVSDDGKRAAIRLDDLREGFVYEIHVRNLAGAKDFFPAEAYYTLRHRIR